MSLIDGATEDARTFREQLHVSRLMKDAETETGLNDWGAPEVVEPLTRIVSSLLEEGRPNASGRALSLARLKMNLRNRLHVVDERRRQPEIARQQIVRPVILAGLPRAGTTLTHNLLSQDPSSRSPRNWEMLRPWPAGPADLDRDPRIPELQAQLQRDGFLSNDMLRMHPYGANIPDEDGFLFESAFLSGNYNAFFGLPSYMLWLIEEADHAGMYRYHREFLQQCQWRAAGERWILKWPVHLFFVQQLLREYPDAIIVQNHRDPASVVPSTAKLQATLQRRSSDQVDANAIAALAVKVWSIAAGRVMKAREDPAVDAHFFDIRFDELEHDPFGLMERLYERFELPLGRMARQRMTRYLAANPRNKHGSNDYRLEEFGLSVTQIDEAFVGYMERFGVAYER
jgi:hypothetical protein